MQYGVKLPKTTGTIAMLRTQLEKQTGIQASRFAIGEVYNGKLWKLMESHDKTVSLRPYETLVRLYRPARMHLRLQTEGVHV